MFNWIKKGRRALLLSEPFPDDWLDHLHRNVPYYAWLTADQQSRLRNILRIIIAEREWVGCDGLEVTDEMRVTIGALAGLLVLEFEPVYYYERLQSVLIYPGPYRRRGAWEAQSGAKGETLAGESWHRGPIVLSWQVVLDGVANPHDGQNVVFHEFAHHLDSADGSADGTPPLESSEQYRAWDAMIEREYDQLVRAAKNGLPSLLDYYGATNRAEFFAVATESFFECGGRMRAEHPQLYDALSRFYRQQTADWPQQSPADEQPSRGRKPDQRHRRPEAVTSTPADDDAAIESWLKQFRLQPGTADAHFSLGFLYLRSHEYANAVASFSEAIRLDPDDPEALDHRGLALLRLGRNKEARADIDRALRLDPDDVDAYRVRAELRVLAHDFARAIEDCRIVLREDKRDPTALYLRGRALSGVGEYEAGLRSLNRAILFDSSRAEFYAERSRVWKLLGANEEAERDRLEAIRCDSGLAESLR